MNKKEILMFLLELEPIGDIWTPEQVKDAYGHCSLDEALADGKAALGTFFDIIGKVINSD